MSVPGPVVPVLLWLAVAAVTVWSAIAPKDVLTWWLEALPALIVLVLLPAIYARFRLTTLACVLVAMHAVVLLVGAHYTYAEVPLFDWVRDAYGLARNHYDNEDVPKAVAMIDKLLAAGAAVVDEEGKMKRDKYGDSLLHLAAMASGRNGPAVLKALVDALPAGGPYTKVQLVSARCKNFGNTALHWATLNGNVDACRLLIEAGTRLDRLNRQKESILDYASKYEHVKLKAKYEGLMK